MYCRWSQQSTGSKGAFPGRSGKSKAGWKLALPPDGEKPSTGGQKTACVHVGSDRIKAGQRKQSWAIRGRAVEGTRRVQADRAGPGDQGAQRPGSNTGSKMTIKGHD